MGSHMQSAAEWAGHVHPAAHLAEAVEDAADRRGVEEHDMRAHQLVQRILVHLR